MASSAAHRRMARVFLSRAYEAPGRERRLKYLRLAVSNSTRAQSLEAKEETTDSKQSLTEDRPAVRVPPLL